MPDERDVPEEVRAYADEEDIYNDDDRPARAVRSTARYGLPAALGIGVGAGIVSVLLNTAITFLNLPTFQQAIVEGAHLQANTAYELVGLQCLNFSLTLLICFGVGYITGRLTARRRLGLYAGALAAMLNFLASFLVRYIPNYPGNQAASSGGAGGVLAGILISLAFLAVWAIIGSLTGLWGASFATVRPARSRPSRRD